MESKMKNLGLRIFIALIAAGIFLMFNAKNTLAVSEADIKAAIDSDTTLSEEERQVMLKELEHGDIPGVERSESKDIAFTNDYENPDKVIAKMKEEGKLTDPAVEQQLRELVKSNDPEQFEKFFAEHQDLKTEEHHYGEYDSEKWKAAETEYKELINSGKTQDEAAKEIGEKYGRPENEGRNYDITTSEGRENAIKEFESHREEMETGGWSKETLDGMERAMREGDTKEMERVMKERAETERDQNREWGRETVSTETERDHYREGTEHSQEREHGRDQEREHYRDVETPEGREAAVHEMEREMGHEMTPQEREMAEKYLQEGPH